MLSACLVIDDVKVKPMAVVPFSGFIHCRAVICFLLSILFPLEASHKVLRILKGSYFVDQIILTLAMGAIPSLLLVSL